MRESEQAHANNPKVQETIQTCFVIVCLHPSPSFHLFVEMEADPIAIPIHTPAALKEWAVIEINGELLPPKDYRAIKSQKLVELGSLRNYADPDNTKVRC